MFSLSCKRIIVILLIFALSSPVAGFAGRRQGTSDIYFGPSWFNADTFKFNGGAEVDIANDNSWRLGYGYNFNKNFELSGDFSWAYTNYTVNTTEDNGGVISPISYNGNMDVFDGYLNGTYNILTGAVAPFITGGIGFTFIDSNIPSGPASGVCWWDPWYGYICTSYQPSHSDTYWSYKAGAGVRWDINNDIFLKGTCSQTWIDISGASGTTFRNAGVDLGFMF